MNRPIRWGISVACVATIVAASLLQGLQGIHGQEAKKDVVNGAGTRLFVPLDLAKSDLTEKQAKILKRIQSSPATVKAADGSAKTQLVKLKKEVLTLDADTLDVPITGELGLKIKNFTQSAGLGTIRLNWKKDETNQLCTLSVGDKNSTGLLYADGKVFAVENIGGGLQAVTQIDQTKYEDTGKDKHGKHPAKARVAAPKKDVAAPAANTPAVIRVLVAYTSKVDDEVADVLSLIDACINITNASYTNSKINLRVELAHVVKVNHNEVSHEIDLDRFRGVGDGKMDEVHKLRNLHAADVCMLLVSNDEYCGLADAIYADSESAFAVIHHECAVKNLSFPHELGHLQGARHDLGSDPTVDPTYPWNHGYHAKKNNWRTVMAYPTSMNPIRVPYFSNPDVTFGSPAEPTGSANHNNAKMLNISAGTLSAFRP